MSRKGKVVDGLRFDDAGEFQDGLAAVEREGRYGFIDKQGDMITGFDFDDVRDFSSGQIILLSTDGIWEARNKQGEMLGKGPILKAIRQNSSSEAGQIIDAIFDTLDQFAGGVKLEDDITSVVIKLQD